MRGCYLIFALALVALLVVGCAPKAAPASPALPSLPQAALSSASVPQAVAKEGWEVRWQKLVEAARKEGSLVIYGPGAYEIRLGLAGPFKQKYGVSVETLALRGAENSERIFAERRAGLYLVDLSFGGATTLITSLKPAGILDPLEPALILPELTEPLLVKEAWWGGELRYVDRDRLILSFCLYPSPGLAINTELVKPGELKSYRDLLNPKWKGRILLNDPTLSGTGLRWFGMMGRKIVSWDYLRELAKQEPVVIRDQRLQAEWLARGKYPVAISPNNSYMRPFFQVGAPVQWLDVEEGAYLTSGGGNIVLLNRAPHPNAAKLFINWLLTQEGQSLWTVAKRIQSLRQDVPTSHLEPVEIRNPKVKYVIADEEDLLLLEPENVRLAKEIIGHLMR